MNGEFDLGILMDEWANQSLPRSKERGETDMKPDEIALLVAVHASKDTPRGTAASLGMDVKRSYYLFEKWTNKGWYNYGVNAGLGWLTEAGEEVAQRLSPP